MTVDRLQTADDIILTEAVNYGKITSIISGKLYSYLFPYMEKNVNRFKAHMANFFNKNHEIIYALAPYDNVYYTSTDIKNLFNAIGVPETTVAKILEECFWFKKPINPQLVKEPYVQAVMCYLIYFLKIKHQKEAEITLIYLAFTGKFYASVFGMSFPYAPPSKYKSVMDYVVNNMLNDKFDLRTQGSVFGAVRSMCLTVLDTYGDQMTTEPDDDEIKYFLQQVRDREAAFMKKIAELYYDAVKNKKYLNYESDNLADGSEFRISDSDATMAARITENAVNYMLNNAVSLKICNELNDTNIKPTELRDIMEAIISDKYNINDLYRVCNILICDFIRKNPGKRVGSIDFLGYSLKEQPNTRDKYIIEMQNIIMSWLDEKSPNYRRRKSRKATTISYRKAVKFYLIMIIAQIANKD